MLFLLDEQLSQKLIAWFKDKGHDAVHVEDVLGAASGDSAIVRFAKTRRAVIISKDADFKQLLAGAHDAPQLVWIRLGNTTTRSLQQVLEVEWPRLLGALERGDAIVELG